VAAPLDPALVVLGLATITVFVGDVLSYCDVEELLAGRH
jgi:hypothetical protein